MATINYKEHLIGSGGSLETAELAEILKEIKGINFFLTEDSKGKERLSIESSITDDDGKPLRLVIAVGPSVQLTEDEPIERIKELVNNYSIYTSTKGRNGEVLTREDGSVVRWFSFGKKTEDLESVVKVSVKDLMASMKAASGAKA